MKTKKNLISSFIVTIFLCFNLQSEVALGQSPSVIIDSVYNFVFPAYHVYGAVNWVIGETCSDLAEVGGDSFSGDFTRDRPEYQQLSLFNISEDNIAIENYYMWNYYGIGWCNLALYKLKLQGIPDPNNKLKTEAITLRALMYFNLVKIFGGVSIYTQNDLKSDSLFNSKFNLDYLAEKSKGWSYVHNIFDYDTIIPRSTASDVYSFIENDLDSVFLYLPSKSSLSLSEKNHVTKGMALALLTNINIYQNQWQKALDYSEQLINSGDYALQSHFSDVFSVSNEHGSESIFEIEQYPHWDILNFFRGFHNTYQNPRALWLKGVTNSKTWGFGFNCPSQNYVSSFPDNDPRKRATILFENDTVLFDINPATNDTSWEILDPKCQQANCNGPSPTGYYEKKYFVTDYDCRLSGSDPKNGGGWFEHGSGAKNICVFRYADILLLASEAALHLGNTTKALNYINQVRTRARNSGNTGFPKNITSITLDSIYNERKWEFGSEGYRLYDLIRTREAYNKLKGIKKAGLNASVMFDSTRNYLFPIPIISIADSKGVLSQNPGYKGWQDIGILAPKKGIQTVEYTIDTTLTSNITPGAVVEFSINFNYELMDPAKLNFNEILNATVIKKKLISGLKDSTIRSGISMDYTMGKSYKDFSDTLVVLLSNVKSQTIDTVLLNVKFIGSKTQIISNTNLERQIKIYPNPVKDIFNLDLSEEIALPVIMKIYSIDGIEVFATKLNSRSSNINLSKLGAGIYILKVVDNNQAIKINKR